MSSPWQSELPDSKARLAHMFETKVLSDCSFLVGKGNQLVAGHKAILSAASPVLYDKLKAAGNDNPKVVLTDIEPEVFQAMLKYIYTDSVDFNSDTVYDLIAAANTYKIPQLLKASCDYIAKNLTTKNVLQAYSIALNSVQSDDLKKKCEEIIKTKTMEVLSDSSFEEACPDVVVAVFSLDYLDIENELDLLNAADRYAKHVTKCVNTDDKETVIRNILQKIRFLSLTPEEFAEGRAATAVLSASDACAILANVAYDKSGVPMPTGFSLRKDPRKKVNVTAIEPIPEIKFKYRVPGIEDILNKNQKAWSSSFKLHNSKWKIGIDTNTKDSKQFLGIYAFNIGAVPDMWSCNAKVEFKLLRVDKGEPIQMGYTQIFKKDDNWGYSEFVEASKLLDPNNHFIEDGAITFEIYMKVVDKP